MTVSLAAKLDVQKSEDDNDNDTCCSNKGCRNWVELQFEGGIAGLRKRKECDESPDENSSEEVKVEANQIQKCCYRKFKKLLEYDDAPEYLKHNTYIRSGYRGPLNRRLCLESIFWWTNETINIWSHILGFVLFVVLAVRDYYLINIYAFPEDKILVIFVLFCFQVCMFVSALYHTFSCRSERDCDFYLSVDLFGIALSLLAIYASGIYYAFWCCKEMRDFYMITVTAIFIGAMILQIPRFKINSNVKMLVFLAWAVYGVVPTVHWVVTSGGMRNTIVQIFLPRVIGMYIISGMAFLIYILKVPERFYSGKFDYFGHSHQWWHIFVVAALLYWHNSGLIYLQYRYNHACPNNLRFS